MLDNAGGLRQKSRINSENTLGTRTRRASHLGVRRSRASVLNNNDTDNDNNNNSNDNDNVCLFCLCVFNVVYELLGILNLGVLIY